MNVFTVSFFGHRYLSNTLRVEQKLEVLVRELLWQHSYVSFLVGRDGEFDQTASSVVRRSKRLVRSDNSALTWVLPYITADFTKNEDAYRNYYDEIEVCEVSSFSHYKSAFQARNKHIVDRSDLIIFCVEHKSGGAYLTMRYAINQGKQIINIGQV